MTRTDREPTGQPAPAGTGAQPGTGGSTGGAVGQRPGIGQRGGGVLRLVVIVVVLFGVLSLLLGMLASWLAKGPERPFGEVLPVVVIGLAPVAIGLTVAVSLARRRRTARSTGPDGSDPDDRRVVRQALREGGSTDPGVDARAREVATQRVSNRWMRWLLVTNLVLQLVLLAGASTTIGRVLALITAVAWAVGLGAHEHALRQARRYLADDEPDRASPTAGG